MSKMRVEIWMGGMAVPTYTIRDVEHVDVSEDGITVRIIEGNGYVFETSPHNIVMITEPEEKNNV